MLWLDMGLGKTVITETAILDRINKMEVWGALVVGSKRIVQRVWKQEARKWEHLRGLRFSVIQGRPSERTRAAVVPADIYLVNYENLQWLVDNVYLPLYLGKGRHPPVNMIVFDEISKMKRHTTNRHKAIRKVLPYIPYRIGLTGTPASNGYGDLFGQFLAVDSGTRLGQTQRAYRERFFHVADPYATYSRFVPNKGAEAHIHSLIADITLQMSNEDYIELPPVIENDITVELTPDLKERYQTLEEEMFMELDSGAQITAVNAGVLTNRCLQFASGAVFLQPGDPRWDVIHDLKLEAFDDIVEEAAGKPILTLFQFRHEAERIMRRYPDAEWIDSSISEKRFDDMIDRWQQGQIPILLGHPASMGHGLDELKNGPVDDLCWFGLNWALDLYLQAIARLQRQGRTRPIRMHRLIVADTVEEVQVSALAAKATTEEGLKLALNEYRRSKIVAQAA